MKDGVICPNLSIDDNPGTHWMPGLLLGKAQFMNIKGLYDRINYPVYIGGGTNENNIYRADSKPEYDEN